MVSRWEKLKRSVEGLYQAKREGRADWADWLYANHIFVVAKNAEMLADRFGGKKEFAMAAAILHDIADAVMQREDPRHEEESLRIAKHLLGEAGFSDIENEIVLDAVRRHSCRNGVVPSSPEGRIMAAADALAHLQTDFYEHAVGVMRPEEPVEEIKTWALTKIERDFNVKISFDDVRREVRPAYERLKQFFEELV